MLENCKPEELIKYSKGTYNKEKFITEAVERWELTDKQLRMVYLISDLSEKANGVFSVSNGSFRKMFEKRFKMAVSRSTVIRFFQLLEELGLLSVHEAKRKNRKQSANIFIMEPLETVDEIPNETPEEIPEEIPEETLTETPYEIHNIDSNIALNKGSNTSQINNVLPIVNYQATEKSLDKNQFKTIMRNTCDEFYTKFAPTRYTKKSWFTLTNKFIQETIESGRYKNIPFHKIKGYVYKSLEKMADHTDYKNSEEYAEYQEVMRELHGQEVIQ